MPSILQEVIDNDGGCSLYWNHSYLYVKKSWRNKTSSDLYNYHVFVINLKYGVTYYKHMISYFSLPNVEQINAWMAFTIATC